MASVFLAQWALWAHLSALTSCTCVSQALGNGSPLVSLLQIEQLGLLSCSHAIGTARCLPRFLHAGSKLADSLVMFKL